MQNKLDTYPIISIVTPNYNYGQFIAETIESIIFQKGDFLIDYIIVDAKSTDDSMEKINFYKNYLEKNYELVEVNGNAFFTNEYLQNTSSIEKQPISISCRGVKYTIISEKDNGQYNAIRKGFSKSIGSIMAYLNSDDFYLPNAFAKVIDKLYFSEFMWLKGINGVYDKKNGTLCTHYSNMVTDYSNWLIKRNYYNSINAPGIQQESCFWKRDLYEQVDGIDDSYNLAADFELWLKFSRKAYLMQIDSNLSGIRNHDLQKSSQIDDYKKEVKLILNKYNIFFSKRKLWFYNLVHKSYNFHRTNDSLFLIYLYKKFIVLFNKLRKGEIYR